MSPMCASARGKAASGWGGATCSCYSCRWPPKYSKVVRRTVKHRANQRWRRDVEHQLVDD